MALSEKQMAHPNYWDFEATAQNTLDRLLARHMMDRNNIMPHHEAQAGRLVDDMVAFLIRVSK